MTARIAWAILSGIVCLGAGIADAAERTTSRDVASSIEHADSGGRDAYRRGLDALPAARMAAEDRRIIEHFHRSTTLYRRLPADTVHCDAALLEFVLTKPEALVDVWRVLGISRVSLDPTAPGCWRLADGYGTEGAVRLMHHEAGPDGSLLVFHGIGGYTGPLAPKRLTGSCLLVVRCQSVVGDGRPAQRMEVEAFLDVDGLGLELVTRTLQPLIVRSAAANVHEICLFVSQFSAAATRNPAGMAVLADQLPRTGPADRRMLCALATGRRMPTADPEATTDVSEELAARWLTAEDLDATRR
jgi:hypothetical protein